MIGSISQALAKHWAGETAAAPRAIRQTLKRKCATAVGVGSGPTRPVRLIPAAAVGRGIQPSRQCNRLSGCQRATRGNSRLRKRF